MTGPAELAAKLRNLGRPSLLVLGDVILDRYTWGVAERVSPEAPVLVLRADGQEVRLGGGASVGLLLSGLDAQVVLAGVVGDDDAGRTVRELFAEARIDQQLVYCDPSRPTTVKERIMGRAAHRRPHQILRIDYEVRDPLSAELEARLAKAIVARLPECAALLVADYYKGLCTAGLLATVIAAAVQSGVPVLIDPARIADYRRYLGATVLVPNRFEAELVAGSKIATPQDALPAGRKFAACCQAQAVIVKLDRQGMLLLQADQAAELVAAHPRPVNDVTGAGDMVLAMLGLCQATGLTLSEAVRLANVAAGLEVERLGVAQVSRQEIEAELARVAHAEQQKTVSLDELVALAPSYRQAGRKIVLGGCPELAHRADVGCLEDAAAQGGVLVVAVYTGGKACSGQPADQVALSPGDQAMLLSGLPYVDHILLLEKEMRKALLARLRPDVMVIGEHGAAQWPEGPALVESYGGKVHITGRPGKHLTQVRAPVEPNRLPRSNLQ